MRMIVSNIGVNPDLSAIYTTNSAMHTAFVQVQLQKEHDTSSFVYMDRVRRKLAEDLPAGFHLLPDRRPGRSIVNQGMPAPIDIQITGNNQQTALRYRRGNGAEASPTDNRVSELLIPQDLDYPGIQLNVKREMAARLGMTAADVVDSVITALTSDGMIAPSYWIDPHSGNNYFLTVQYTPKQIGNMTPGGFQADYRCMPPGMPTPTMLENVADVKIINTPTEVDHYQLSQGHRSVRFGPKAKI